MLKELLQQDESETLEYKTSFGREAIEALTAFANSKGGTLVVGVNDKRKVVGVTVSQESLQQWVNQVKSATSPSIVPEIEVLQHQKKDVILLSVPAYPVKPVSFKGKYYSRRHGSNHLMNLEEITNEHLKSINLSWDFAPDPGHSVSDISFEKVNRFVSQANSLREHAIEDAPLTVLRKFELLRESNITFGCFLLFCKEPTLSTTIDVGRFDLETIVKDSEIIRDDLFSEVEACLAFIHKHNNKHFIITGKSQREEVWEYPPAAVREIVINMIVHRDYRASADSTVKIFRDRIEFFNPGPLPEGLSMEEILSGRSASNPRNKQIASIFKEAGIIEKYGSGIRRVRQIMKSAGAGEPVFEVVGNVFKVTLLPINGGVNGGVNDLLDYVQSNPGKKTGDLKAVFNLPQRTLERWLKQLKEENKIEFRGAAKTGGYFAK